MSTLAPPLVACPDIQLKGSLPMIEACDPNPILCFGTRSGIVETVHRGAICCVQIKDDGSSDILQSIGNIEQIFYPRSALKYVQVLPLLESGAIEYFGFSDEEVSVMCASHNAEPCHLEVVRSILQKIVSP